MSLLGYGISWIKICHNATCIRTTRRGIRQHFFESARSTITSTDFHIVVGKKETAKNMEGSSSAQRKARTGNKCVKNFLSKRQEVSFIAQC